MITRDILDFQGNVIGQINFPDDTSALDIINALAPYAQAPLTTGQIISNKINQYEAAADGILGQIKTALILNNITPSQSAQTFANYSDCILLTREGAFMGAIYQLQQKTPDSIMTQDLINTWISLLQANL